MLARARKLAWPGPALDTEDSMSNGKDVSRRDALKLTFALGAATVGSTWLGVGCKGDTSKELSCSDTTGVAPADIEMRKTLKYVAKSAVPAKTCANCQLFKAPPTPGTCGGCTVVKGSINPAGFCDSWARKPA
jgi:hypothetical protein